MGIINTTFQHCIWSTKNWEQLINDEGIRQELCEFIRSRAKTMNIGIEDIYCKANHLHYLCMYPESENILGIYTKLKEQTQGWLAAKGYADVEWDDDYLLLPVSENELDDERRFIRELMNNNEMRSLDEVYRTLFNRII